VKGMNDERFVLEEDLDPIKLEKELKRIFDQGIKSISVALMHSYSYGEHELKIKEIAEKVGI